MALPDNLDHLKIMIADPNSQSRVNLREALRAVHVKKTPDIARKVNDAILKLKQGVEYDVIFLSSTFPKEELQKFLSEAIAFDCTAKTLFIISLKAYQLQSSYVANLYVGGVHGFICEPYSTGTLQNLIKMVQEQGSTPRNNDALKSRTSNFLIEDIIKNVDEMAKKEAMGLGSGFAVKTLRSSVETLRNLFRESDDEFYDFLTEKMMAVPVPENLDGIKKKRERKRVVHPGEILKKQLEERKISIEFLVSYVNADEEELQAILDQKGPVTKTIAEGLARTLGGDARFWVDLQDKFNKKIPIKV